jgi:crossover junction endodeoxyribonuclease RuvC
MRIISIDPGYERVGIAILEKIEGKEKVIFSECFKTDKGIPLNERILLIGTEVGKIVKEFTPEGMAIERLYFTTNQKTAMGVSEARGVIINEAKRVGLKVFEYTPLQVKIAVTGYGKASKNQVISMVKKLVSISQNVKSDDEIDAIAVGLTCLASERF